MAFVNLPPNFQDMFYSITDRIAKLETGPNQAMYTAEAAQGSSAQASNEAAQALSQAQAANALGVQALATANIAIAQGTQAIQTANEALVEADAAYALGAQSLQKSANTITNASNQITAINGNGITVYSGASASSGARVVLNSAGLAGFNSGGTATFLIDASTGGVSTNGAIFTSSTITGGSLNINGNAIINSSGFLTAVGATITGNITATSGTFTGVVNATSGTFTGTITSSNATITGGSLNVGGNFIVTSAGALTATGANITGAITSNSGTIAGWVLSSTAISKTVGTKTLSLDSTNAIITINDSSSGILAGGGINMTAGAITGSYGAGGFNYSGSSVTSAISQTGNSLLIQGGATTSIRLQPGAGLSSTTYNVQVEGHLNTLVDSLSAGNFSTSSTNTTAGCYMSASGAIIGRRDNQIPFFAHKFNATGTTEMIRLVYNGADAGGITTTSGGVPAFRNASDYRLKQNIQSFDSAASIIKQINLRSYEFIKDPEEPQVGFIAHELAEVLPALVLGEKDAIDEDGNPAYQSILATNLIPYLTGALKEAILRIEALERA